MSCAITCLQLKITTNMLGITLTPSSPFCTLHYKRAFVSSGCCHSLQTAKVYSQSWCRLKLNTSCIWWSYFTLLVMKRQQYQSNTLAKSDINSSKWQMHIRTAGFTFACSKTETTSDEALNSTLILDSRAGNEMFKPQTGVCASSRVS